MHPIARTIMAVISRARTSKEAPDEIFPRPFLSSSGKRPSPAAQTGLRSRAIYIQAKSALTLPTAKKVTKL
jgi:hypothetical protein